MATQALASNNSRRESREIRDPRKFLALVDRLGLPPHLRASYKGYYEVSGSPIGPNPQSWKGLRKAARDMGISYRTFKRHHRKFQQLGLLQFAARPNADRRSKTWNFLIDQLEEQAWPDDICPRCRHRHADTECGCKLTPRHWPTKGWVERHCRCVPRPSENRGRKGPQPVPPAKTQVPPAAPPELPPAATSPVPASPLTPGSPAAVREKQRRGTNTTLVGMILDGSRKAERIRKLRAALGIRIAELINGVTWIRNAQGISRPVEEGHPQFRHPLPRDQALRKACEELGITEAEGRLLWQAEGGK